MRFNEMQARLGAVENEAWSKAIQLDLSQIFVYRSTDLDLVLRDFQESALILGSFRFLVANKVAAKHELLRLEQGLSFARCPVDRRFASRFVSHRADHTHKAASEVVRSAV